MDLREVDLEGVDLIYLVQDTSGRLLWTREWAFGFHKW